MNAGAPVAADLLTRPGAVSVESVVSCTGLEHCEIAHRVTVMLGLFF